MAIVPYSYSPKIKPKWNCSLGYIEGIVRYNCRKYGLPIPVLCMPFWEGAGNKVYDVSGNRNDGTLTGGPKWVGGKFGNALSFDGTNDYVNILDNPFLDGTSTMSWSFWVSSNDVTATYPMISKWKASDYYRSWRIYQAATDGEIGLSTCTNGLTLQYTANSLGFELTNNTWTHVGIVFDSGNVKFYKNGMLNRDTSVVGTSIYGGLQPLEIGKYLATYFSGKEDNVQIYNRALTAAQVKFLYDNPHFMIQMPEELWGYVEEVIGGTDKTYTIDSLFKKLDIDKNYSVDTLLKLLDIDRNYVINTILQKTGIINYSADTLIKLLNIDKNYVVDTLFKKLNIDKTYSIDTLLSVLGTDKSYVIDVLFQKLNIDRNYNIDVLIKLLNVDRNYNLDTLIKALDIDSNYNIDTLIKALNIDRNYVIDVILSQAGVNDKNYSIDALIQKLNLDKNYSIDALIQKLNVDKSYVLDVILKYSIDKNYTIDALIKKLNIDTNYVIDILIKLTNIDETYSIDTLIKKLNIENNYVADLILKAIIDENYSIDTLIKKLNNELNLSIDVRLSTVAGEGTQTYVIDGIIVRIVSFKPTTKGHQVKPTTKGHQVKPTTKGHQVKPTTRGIEQ